MNNVDQIKTRARGLIVDQIDQRTTAAGAMLQEHVMNLRNMSNTLREQGLDSTAHLVDMAAERLNRCSTYLTDTDGDRMIHDVESLARRQPTITAGLGFVAGLAAARVLKASAGQRYRTYVEEYDYGS